MDISNSNKVLQELALAHYHRMLEWAKLQNPNDCISMPKMQRAIHEVWGVTNCCYCSIYRRWTYNNTQSCTTCPLRSDKGCCDGYWRGMSRAYTWAEWVAGAEDVYKYIEEMGGN